MSSSAPDGPSPAAAPAEPALSIVIPTYRRPALLRRALDHLEPQAAGRVEVLVVDDAQDDPVAVAAAVEADARPFPVVRPVAMKRGAAAARNAGWRAARAPLVLFLGDDILADDGLVDRHLAAHAAMPDRAVAVLGHVRWADELRVTPFMRFLDEGVQFDYAHMEAGDVGWPRLYTANVSFKRALLEAAGGFDEGFTIPYEDIELGRRLHDLGLRLMYEPHIRAQHVHPATLADWGPRMAACARAERAMVARHPDFAPYFANALRDWRGQPSSGLAARVAAHLPETLPVVGPRVHAAARAHWKVTLANAFFGAAETESAA